MGLREFLGALVRQGEPGTRPWLVKRPGPPFLKIPEIPLLFPTSTASNGSTYGFGIDVSAYSLIDVRIRMGRGTSAAFTTAPTVRLEKSYKRFPGPSDWCSAAEFQPALGSSIGSQAVSGTAAAGATTVTLAAGTNFAAADYVFWHNTALTSAEWSRVQSISGAVLTLEEPLGFAQTGATARNQAEQYTAVLDVRAIQRVRFVVDGAGSGQAVIFEAAMGAWIEY